VCAAKPLPSAVTSTFSKRPLRCTFKVIPPSRVYEFEQPEESLLKGMKPRPQRLSDPPSRLSCLGVVAAEGPSVAEGSPMPVGDAGARDPVNWKNLNARMAA
jgi:hypothetical protein